MADKLHEVMQLQGQLRNTRAKLKTSETAAKQSKSQLEDSQKRDNTAKAVADLEEAKSKLQSSQVENQQLTRRLHSTEMEISQLKYTVSSQKLEHNAALKDLEKLQAKLRDKTSHAMYGVEGKKATSTKKKAGFS